jgi:hypothetical protein
VSLAVSDAEDTDEWGRGLAAGGVATVAHEWADLYLVGRRITQALRPLTSNHREVCSMTTSEASGWIEISREREMPEARQIARDILASHGLDPDNLSSEVVRLDVGLDEERQTYYRVRVHESVLSQR